MIRNLKVLGLALVAVFAMSAVVASAASAQGTLTSDGPVTLTGTQTGAANENSLTAFGGVVTCPPAKYTGHKTLTISETATKKHELLPNGSTKVTITPHYGLCNTNLIFNFSTTVDMNGCDYEFHLQGTKVGGTDEYNIHSTVVCPVGKHIQVTMYTNATHTPANHFCTVTVTENPAGYAGLVAKDTTNGTVDITGTINGIEAHKETTATDASGLCSKQTTTTGVLHIDASVTGHDSLLKATPIALSHP